MNIKLAALLICALVFGNHSLAKDETPLLMEGKTNLYQRVLVKPNSQLFTKPGQLKEEGSLPAFSIFYVYDKKTEKTAWTKVGSDSHGNVLGWVKSSQLIPWNQGLTVAFKDNQNSDRVMLFRDKDSLETLIKEPDLAEYKKLYQSAVLGTPKEDSPVIAIAPKSGAQMKDNFYLVPILDFEDTYLKDEQATMLKVATVSLRPQKTVKEAIPQPVAETEKPVALPTETPTPEVTPVKPFKTGVVFVIDSTLSMGPYIERTRTAVRKIYKQLASENTQSDTSFGLIAYRDSIDAAEGLEYLTHTYATLKDGQNEADFFSHVDSLKAATSSSKDFYEDTYAGMNRAIEGIDWDGMDARYIILITDAGARAANDPDSKTKLSAENIQAKAQKMGIATTVLHLLTPIGQANHEDAQKQYEALSLYPDVGSLYFGVDAGDVNRFGQVLDSITQQIGVQVTVALKNRPTPEPIAPPEKAPPVKAEPPKVVEVETAPAADEQLESLKGKIAKIGNALQIQYLQRNKDEAIPDVFDAWLIDHDIRNPEVSNLEVRVLLTRDQLSDLHEVSRRILDTFEEGLLTPKNFLDDLKSLAATLSRDPEAITTSTGAANLASMGMMQEYISDLPYQSSTLNLSSDEWESWTPKQQISFTHRLEEKVAYYRAVYSHTDLWVNPGSEEIDGDSIFALPLDMLP